MDDLKRAYAVLGLAPGCPSGRVKRRYRALVRTWHPDRHTRDPVGQAEAAVRMRVINAAYRKVARHLRRLSASNKLADEDDTTTRQQRRLTPEEIDGMVRAIRHEGPIDSLLGLVGWVGDTLSGVFALLLPLGFAIWVGRALWERDLGVLTREPRALGFFAILALLFVQEYVKQRRLQRTLADTEGPTVAHGKSPSD